MKCPYSANRYLDTSKLPSYMTPLLGTTEAVRAEPFSMSKTGVRHPHFCKPFNKANVVGKAKRSSKIMVAGLSTSRRENIKHPRKKRASLAAGVESTYGGGKSSLRDSQGIFEDTNVGKKMVANLSTCYLKPTNLGQVCFPCLSMLKSKNEIFLKASKPTTRGAVCFKYPYIKFLKTAAEQAGASEMSPIFRKIFECLSLGAPTRKLKLINIVNHERFPIFGVAPICGVSAPGGAVCLPNPGMLKLLKSVSMQEELTRMSPIFRKFIECLPFRAPTRKQQFVNIENHTIFPTFGVVLRRSSSESKNEKVPRIRKPTARGAVSFQDLGLYNVFKNVSMQEQVTRMSPIFEKIIECLSVRAPTRKLLHVNIEDHQMFPTFGVALMRGV